MKKLVPALVASAALVSVAPASGNADKYCSKLADTKYEARCLAAIDVAVEQLNAAGRISDIKPAKACAELPRKKARGVKGGTPFSLCVKAIAKFKAEIPPPPPAPGS